jgi:hypothetical protein
MTKPFQPCLADPIPTTSSQIVVTYKHTHFDEDRTDLENYPYLASPSSENDGRTCAIHFVEFRCLSAPPSDIGHPGDVWIDLTPDQFGLYARVGADWRKWPGMYTQDDLLIVHPHIPTRALWCTKHRVTWLKRRTIMCDWAARQAESSDQEMVLTASHTICRMLTNEVPRDPHWLRALADSSEGGQSPLDIPASTMPIVHATIGPSGKTGLSSQGSDPTSVQDISTEQHLFDRISDLEHRNRGLAEEVVRLRHENECRRSNGPFRDVIMATVGKGAFSEELLDIAKDAVISQLTKTVTRCEHLPIITLCAPHGIAYSQFQRNYKPPEHFI